ncbi:hypothetical protein IAR55_002352 [Kwoniella newhampshirensis]|uniref:Uncharacterized protein n=1 Tax=Kwoniella newhampshirensis TaxID=1651941 RepID=A0AAW0YQM8_9TREE
MVQAQASPALLLEALRAHLLPSPIFPRLQSALEIYAHFQILSRQLRSEAHRAVMIQEEMLQELDAAGYDPIEQVRRGTLNEYDGQIIGNIGKRDGDDMMFGFSLEFRKYYFAFLLSSPTLTPKTAHDVRNVIDTYLPDLAQSSIASTPVPLFISCMTSSQAEILGLYRQTVLGWYDRAQESLARGECSLPFETFYSGQKGRGQRKRDTLVHNLIKEAEKVVRDVEQMRNVFENQEDTEVKEEEEEEKEEEVEGEEEGIDTAYMIVGAKGEGLRADSNRRHTFGPSTSSNAHNGAALPYLATLSSSHRYRSSLPVAGPSRLRDHPALLSPRPGFITDTRRSHESHVHAQQEPNGAAGNVSSEAEPPARLSTTAGSQDRRKTTAFTPTRAESGIATQQPRSAAAPASSSAKPNKRPRQSFPPSGPDYTVRTKDFGDNIDRERLRPFDNSEFYKSKKARSS